MDKPVRRCQECETLLPDNAPNARKFCLSCAKKRVREQKRNSPSRSPERRKEYRRKPEVMQKQREYTRRYDLIHRKGYRPCANPECTKLISAASLTKHPEQRYCSHACATAARGDNFFKRFSAQGLQAQRDLAVQLGERPGNAKRSEAMKRHNALHPRTGPHKKWSRKGQQQET